MAVLLKNLYSIINGKLDAKDAERSFTFIEFIKEFGYDNTPSSFLSDYKSYLSLWANATYDNHALSDKEFIRRSLTDTLKSIVLTYSSYEEQDFLANIDWNNPIHQKAIVPFFAEKIKSICNFYKNKRQEAHLIVNKNSFKGSRISLEQIIYDKILDFYFENKNLKPQISHLQHNLTISIEEYIDLYSEYFDIPRHKKCTDESRQKLIEANINNVDYKDYIQLSKIISDSLFNGELYLEEIPLIAQVGLDLSQKCAGDVATLRDVLLNEATINQVSLGDQISLRRKLYEKYLGCDLYYIYCDTKDSIYIDVLTRADNPSGNLLNCGTADTATVESDKVELLSNIGLFFKPDKTGILKINANDFSWEIDKSKLSDETFYIFPDPNKYGDIGNNKSQDYPLIYEYKLNEYIKNISSGWAKDDPLAYISTTTWNTYYSKQDNDYILNDNHDYSYSFTALANLGIISDYQTDMFGNEYALVKGYTNEDGVFEVPSKFALPEVNFKEGSLNVGDITSIQPDATLLNGGYFRDPRFEKDDKAFPYDVRLRIKNDYMWSGVIPQTNYITTPDILTTHIDAGNFTDKVRNIYVDHYSAKPQEKTRNLDTATSNKSFKDLVFQNFNYSLNTHDENGNEVVKVRLVNKTFDDIKNEEGKLFFKSTGCKASVQNVIADNVKKFSLIRDILIIEKADNIIIYKQNEALEFIEIYNNNNENDEIETPEGEIIPNPAKLFYSGNLYNILYNETEDAFYIAVISISTISDSSIFNHLGLRIHKFEVETKKLITDIINTATDEIELYIDENDVFDNFELISLHDKLDSFTFSYNNNHDVYLISYLLNDNAYYPYLYEHKFRIYNKARFYNTLNTNVYYNMDSPHTNIFNATIETALEDETPFFIPA